jgi:hypothetical protein
VELWTEADGVGRHLYTSLGFDIVAEEEPEFLGAQAENRYIPSANELRMRLVISSL